MQRPILTKIVGKFQVTIPTEVRELFDLREGDLFEWTLDEHTRAIRIAPMRAQLITPEINQLVSRIRRSREEKQQKQEKPKLAHSGG